MSIITIENLLNTLSPGSTLVGLDLGTKTIGTAVSDLSLSIARPRYTIKRTNFSLDAIKLQEFFKKENASAIVIGLPINMNGSEGPRVQATRAFVTNMEAYTNLPFIFQDERLSTFEATRTLIEQNFSRAKRKKHIDSTAASFILQSALDRLSFLKRNMI